MLRGKYKTYDKLYIYILKGFHPELRSLSDEDLIGVWEEDGIGVLFFHREKDELVNSLCKKLGLELEEKDVVNYKEWMENRFPQPIQIGNISIAPIWCKGNWDIVFDPSVVFGEGRHPTTYTVLELCWEFYESYGLPKKVIDIGCGTGVLTLFWAYLGSEVTAIDINPLCVEVTLNNLKMNGLSSRVKLLQGDVKKFLPLEGELVVANLYKGLILDLFGLPSFWTSDYYIVSGFRPDMEEEIRSALSPFSVEVIKRKEKEGWVSWLLKNFKKL
ncbi:MAG: methyltransferase domain-containing protein [Thermodesulfobacteria bacterium]|nr:methyltransferase domain-containing protein [Thermodesulfobacteriota bacterium]